jgi:hypothetical protein
MSPSRGWCAIIDGLCGDKARLNPLRLSSLHFDPCYLVWQLYHWFWQGVNQSLQIEGATLCSESSVSIFLWDPGERPPGILESRPRVGGSKEGTAIVGRRPGLQPLTHQKRPSRYRRKVESQGTTPQDETCPVGPSAFLGGVQERGL